MKRASIATTTSAAEVDFNSTEQDIGSTAVDSTPLDRKIEGATVGLRPEFSNLLHGVTYIDALIIVDYIQAVRVETNLSDNYRKDLIKLLCIFSKYYSNTNQSNNKNNIEKKTLRTITRCDVISFLESFRRLEASDPMHKWIGTYNTYRAHLIRFFKWLYYPGIEPNKRPEPEVVQNIARLKRKEKSIYKPTDLWTAKDDLLFLKYCSSKRNKCFHAMSCDTGCRPHELLRQRIKVPFFCAEPERVWEGFWK